MNKNNSSLAKYKIFIMPTILFLIFVLSIIFILKPFANELKENSDDIQKKIVELEIEGDKISELPKIKEKFMRVDADRAELEILFSERKIVELVQEIEKIAEETGNSISISVDEKEGLAVRKPKASKDEEDEVKLLEGFLEEEYFKMDIEVIGNYKGLINFIERFNGLKYYNSLVGFDIESYEEEYKEERGPVGTDTVSANSSLASEGVSTSKLALKSKLNFVFYLNKIVKENKADDNES